MKRPSLQKKFQAEYCALKNAVDRCTRTSHPQYKDYGGRGLSVDPEFLCPVTGFATFLAEVGRKTDPSLTLERVCNDKGYEPGNLAWADRSTQMKNRRPRVARAKDLGWGVRNHTLIGIDGKKHTNASALVPLGDRIQTIKEWSIELGVATHTLTQRLQRGWSPEQALTSTIYTPTKAPKPTA